MRPEDYHFTEDGNTCVITDPRTPRHWYNYIWSETGYVAQVSQMGHGKSYYIDEKANMCRINSDSARYIYLRDDTASGANVPHSGDTSSHPDQADPSPVIAWNIGEGPLNTPVENYRCEHSIADTRISSTYDGIDASWHIFVPHDAYHEVWTVTLTNHSDAAKTLSMFSAVSFELEGFHYPRYYEQYRTLDTSFDSELNGIFCHSAHPFAPHKRYQGFLASSEPVFAYDGDLNEFCGSLSTITQEDTSARALFQRPDVVMRGRDCTDSEAALFIEGGVLQHRFTLGAGETKVIRLVFGVSGSIEEARAIAAGCRDEELVKKQYEGAVENCRRKYGTLQLDLPDRKMNAIFNNWVRKQIDLCIVGKKGVRDNLQIAVALLNYRPEKAKAEILECLRHQFEDGHSVLTWYPYDDTRYSDQPFWIIWAVCELIKETGDFSILDQKISWESGSAERMSWQDPECPTVLDHILAAARCLICDRGPHGLVLLRFADWNDALNVTSDPEAESVMLSEQACLAFRELAALLEACVKHHRDAAAAGGVQEQTGSNDLLTQARFLRSEYSALAGSINRWAWDGRWYVRALTKDGPVGSQSSDGSHIYLNAQTWALFAGIVPPDRVKSVLKAVDGMEMDFGFPLNLPAYEHYDPKVGRMSGMLPGLYENGGVYCHASAFKMMMDCAYDRSEQALRTMEKIMPDSPCNSSARSGAEPYVFTNCFSTHPKYYGKSYQSWTTGTSAWTMRSMLEGILGVKRDYDGLRIDPCFPGRWESAAVTRHFRGAQYHITYRNPSHLERGRAVIMSIDGSPVAKESGYLPDFRDGRRHELEVVISR